MRLYDLIGGDKSTYNDVPLVVAFQADGEGPYRDIEELQALKQEIELPVFVDHQDENHELLTLWHLIQDTITYLETRHRVSSRFQMPLNTWQNVVRDFEQEILQSKTTLGGEK